MNFYNELLSGFDKLDSRINVLPSGDKIKLSSFDQLLAFSRISNNVLVHKAKKDLWRIAETEDGKIVIERLFDPSTKKALRV